MNLPQIAELRTHLDDGVLTLTLNRPERKNSLTAEMYAALAQAMGEAATSPEVKVVVLQGTETVFCAGNDIGDFLNHPPSTPDAPVFRFLQALATFDKPLVAAVCGPAVGVGTTALLHCDLVYAGDNAAFAMPFVNLGLCPEAASSLLAPRVLGALRANEALLLGEPFYAEAALEVGLVNKVLPPSEVTGYAQTVARKLAAKPQASVLATKKLLKQGQQAEVLQRIHDEVQVFAQLLQGPAAKEAFTAFGEKRKPNFAGL